MELCPCHSQRMLHKHLAEPPLSDMAMEVVLLAPQGLLSWELYHSNPQTRRPRQVLDRSKLRRNLREAAQAQVPPVYHHLLTESLDLLPLERLRPTGPFLVCH